MDITKIDFSLFSDKSDWISHNGSDYNHPIAVRVDNVPTDEGRKTVILSKDGIDIRRTELEGRDVNIEILFYAEDGYCWNLNFRFHEGMTYCHTDSFSLPETMRTIGMLHSKTISRD